jgi:hypothetical protein
LFDIRYSVTDSLAKRNSAVSPSNEERRPAPTSLNYAGVGVFRGVYVDRLHALFQQIERTGEVSMGTLPASASAGRARALHCDSMAALLCSRPGFAPLDAEQDQLP